MLTKVAFSEHQEAEGPNERMWGFRFQTPVRWLAFGVGQGVDRSFWLRVFPSFFSG